MASGIKIKLRSFVIGIVLLVLLLILGTYTAGVFSPIPYRHLNAFKGKVIDADSKEPIDGAVALAVYYKETYTVAGSNSWAVDGQEVITDKNGEFSILSKRKWLALYRGYTEGNLTIFKPGYGVFPRHRNSKAVGENKTWPPPDKYVVYELPKLETRDERRSNIPIRPDIPYEKMMDFVRLINEERINLGLRPLTVPKKGSE